MSVEVIYSALGSLRCTPGCTAGQYLLGERAPDGQGGSIITLNKEYIPAGNDPLTNESEAKWMEDTLAHEVNHAINNVPVGATYRYFMDEYRAWYVGYPAGHGRPPSQTECYDRACYLINSTRTDTGRACAYLDDPFHATGSEESNEIVRFMARLIGADPATATTTSVVLQDPYLAATGVGLAPEAADPSGPNNLDDHN